MDFMDLNSHVLKESNVINEISMTIVKLAERSQ